MVQTDSFFLSFLKSYFIHAGKVRGYNISKKEWVFDSESVIYGNAINLKETVEYDLTQEKNFDYRNLLQDDMVRHIAKFFANLDVSAKSFYPLRNVMEWFCYGCYLNIYNEEKLFDRTMDFFEEHGHTLVQDNIYFLNDYFRERCRDIDYIE